MTSIQQRAELQRRIWQIANESLNTDLANIFAAIEASANGYPSEQDIKGLFADFEGSDFEINHTTLPQRRPAPRNRASEDAICVLSRYAVELSKPAEVAA